jgi:hypothetical protein
VLILPTGSQAEVPQRHLPVFGARVQNRLDDRGEDLAVAIGDPILTTARMA